MCKIEAFKELKEISESFFIVIIERDIWHALITNFSFIHIHTLAHTHKSHAICLVASGILSWLTVSFYSIKMN